MKRHWHLPALLAGSLLLTACLGSARPGDSVPCFTFDGEERCEQPGEDITLPLGFSAEEAEGWIWRFHPEDAERYGFPESIPVVVYEATGRTAVEFVRTIPTPRRICVNHTAYIQDPTEGLQRIAAEAGLCFTAQIAGIDDQEWIPIS